MDDPISLLLEELFKDGLLRSPASSGLAGRCVLSQAEK